MPVKVDTTFQECYGFNIFVRCCYGNEAEFKELIKIIKHVYGIKKYKILFAPFVPEENLNEFEKRMIKIKAINNVIVRPIRKEDYPGDFEDWEQALSEFEFVLPELTDACKHEQSI